LVARNDKDLKQAPHKESWTIINAIANSQKSAYEPAFST